MSSISEVPGQLSLRSLSIRTDRSTFLVRGKSLYIYSMHLFVIVYITSAIIIALVFQSLYIHAGTCCCMERSDTKLECSSYTFKKECSSDGCPRTSLNTTLYRMAKVLSQHI